MPTPPPEARTTSRAASGPACGLAPGLVLRTARPDDADQIGALLADRGEPEDAEDHRLIVDDPAAGWQSCAVVVDGDRVVSTLVLLEERLRVGQVWLPAGQVELVATHPDYEGRGLVRALMSWAHDRSAARGHLVQVMLGIPYFYRRLGYAYAVNLPKVRQVRAIPAADPATDSGGAAPDHLVRAATPADVPALQRLHDRVQQAADVAVPHSPQCWQWLVARSGSTTWVAERSGDVVATARTAAGDDGVVLAELAADGPKAANAVLQHAASLDPERRVFLEDRVGAVINSTWTVDLEDAEPGVEQYYLRIPDEGALLHALRPVLTQRLRLSGLDRRGAEVVVSTFARHHRMAVADDGELGPVRSGGVMQAPGSVGGCGVAPDHLADLLFGPHGMAGLNLQYPDVYPGRDAELMAALFPPLRADLLTLYLPH